MSSTYIRESNNSEKELAQWWQESTTAPQTPTNSLKNDEDIDNGPVTMGARHSNYGVGDFYYNMASKRVIVSHFNDKALLSQCENLRHIGHGSHSNVMICKYKSHKVVVKVLSDKYCHHPTAQQEFQREVAILTRITHNHILNIYASGIEYYRALIILEYLEGGTLKRHLTTRRLEATRPFSEIRYLRMARELADALDYLHRRFDGQCMLIHRDLKPDNIGFTADGTLKLFDFGLCIAVEKGKSDNGVFKLSGKSIYSYIES